MKKWIVALSIIGSIALTIGLNDTKIAAANEINQSVNKNNQQNNKIENQLRLISAEPIAIGVISKKYNYQIAETGRMVSVQVIEADLKKSEVEIDLLYGKNKVLPAKQSIERMIEDDRVVAAINADFFVTKYQGSSMGAQVANGELISSPAQIQGMYNFGITKDRKAFIGRYQFDGMIVAADGDANTILGWNKAPYWTDPGSEFSHQDYLHIYDHRWDGSQRALEGNAAPCEAIISNQVVQRMACPLKDQTIEEGTFLVRGTGKASRWMKEHIFVGDTVQLDMKMIAMSNTPAIENVQTLTGGHTLLVQNGKPSSFTRDVSSIQGNRARTAVGMSADQQMVYMVTVSGDDHLQGINLQALQKLLIELGVNDALNLDGGMSTQMVRRPLGEHQRVTEMPFSRSDIRPVVNGLAVRTTALSGTQLIFKDSPTFYFIGEELHAHGKAFDENFLPIVLSEDAGSWYEKGDQQGDVGQFISSKWIAQRPGITELVWTKIGMGAHQHTARIEVIGEKQMRSFGIEMKGISAEEPVKSGMTLTPRLMVQHLNGSERMLPIQFSIWTCKGAKVTLDEESGEIRIGVITQPILQCEFSYDDVLIKWARPTAKTVQWLDWSNVTTNKMPTATLQANRKKIQLASKSVIEKQLQPSKRAIVWKKQTSKTVQKLNLTLSLPQTATKAIPKTFVANSVRWQMYVPNELRSIDIITDPSKKQPLELSGQKDQWQTVAVDLNSNSKKIQLPKLSLQLILPKSKKVNNVNLLGIGSAWVDGYEQMPADQLFEKTLVVYRSTTTKTVEKVRTSRVWNKKLYIPVEALRSDTQYRITWNASALQPKIRWDGIDDRVQWLMKDTKIWMNGTQIDAAEAKWLYNQKLLKGLWIEADTLEKFFGYNIDWNVKTNRVKISRLHKIDNQR